MSIKKTWFSYILWLLATGFSILFTYSYIWGIVTCYSFDIPKPVYSCIGLSAAFVLGVSLIYVLLRFWRSRTVGVSIPKWGVRLFHILILFGIISLFAVTRCRVLWSTAFENIVQMDIYEAAKVISGNGQTVSGERYFVFEDIYINILSGLFLFLGNKMEIMLYFQIFLQALSLLLLLFIGRTLQKNFWGWIPALVYALSQYCMDAVVCLGTDNLCFFFVLLCLAVICVLEKAWKNKTGTYILFTITGLLFAVFAVLDSLPHVADWNVIYEFWFYEKWINGVAEGYWSFLILMALLCFYCISFFRTKTDHTSAYILPVAVFSGLIYFDLDANNLTAIFMLLRIYMSFMAAEGLRVLFEAKPKVMTGQDINCNVEVSEQVEEERNDFDWTEMKELMEQKKETLPETDSTNEADVVSEDTGVIRVSDILKVVNEEDTVDKTAMIENVLPMPKKHVTRNFEYAFEPTEDMMHYDVEIENDDYDFD